MTKLIDRTEYLEELKRWKDKDVIKVVTGIRRSGKSTLFELFINYLKSIGIKDEQIIHVNLEDAKYDFTDYKDLYNYINDQIEVNKKYYIFLDEVQNVKDFQKAVDSLYIKDNVDVYITGSNAYLLSGELATLLSGRYIELKMLPLSFKEYVTAFDDKDYYFKISGVKRITMHQFRRSHASLLISNNVPLNIIAKRLGDTPDVVAQTYAHLFPQKEAEVLNILNKF